MRRSRQLVPRLAVAFALALLSPTATAAPTPRGGAAKAAARGQGGARAVTPTLLRVTSNVSAAQVFVDGILLGGVNQPLSVSAGSITFEVQAPDHTPRRLTVVAAARHETTANVVLEKRKRPAARPALAAANTSPVTRKPRSAAKPRGETKRASASDAKYMPDPGVDTGDRSGADDSDSLLDEFERESKGQTSAARGCPYCAPPAACCELAQGIIPPGTWTVPPAPEPPLQDTAVADPVTVYPDPAPPRSASPRSKASASDAGYLALLPFGAGQIHDDRLGLGLVFAAAELGALYYAYSEHQAAELQIKKAKDYVAAATAGKTAEEIAAMSQAERDRMADYQRTSNAYATEKNRNATLGLAAFAGLWAVGAVEALVHGPAPAPKRKKPRARDGFDFSAEQRHAAPEFAWHVTPALDAPGGATPGAQLLLRWGL
jgi:hypothetical protein